MSMLLEHGKDALTHLFSSRRGKRVARSWTHCCAHFDTWKSHSSAVRVVENAEWVYRKEGGKSRERKGKKKKKISLTQMLHGGGPSPCQPRDRRGSGTCPDRADGPSHGTDPQRHRAGARPLAQARTRASSSPTTSLSTSWDASPGRRARGCHFPAASHWVVQSPARHLGGAEVSCCGCCGGCPHLSAGAGAPPGVRVLQQAAQAAVGTGAEGPGASQSRRSPALRGAWRPSLPGSPVSDAPHGHAAAAPPPRVSRSDRPRLQASRVTAAPSGFARLPARLLLPSA